MQKRDFLRLINLWPPNLGAGILVKFEWKTFKRIDVRMAERFYNRNYFGTHYGGSLYSMTDPWYALMLSENLGRSYIVWDKAASIRFKKPGRGTVHAVFEIEDALLERIRTQLSTEPKMDLTLVVYVKDAEGDVVAEVEKVIYIRKKEAV